MESFFPPFSFIVLVNLRVYAIEGKYACTIFFFQITSGFFFVIFIGTLLCRKSNIYDEKLYIEYTRSFYLIGSGKNDYSTRNERDVS